MFQSVVQMQISHCVTCSINKVVTVLWASYAPHWGLCIGCESWTSTRNRLWSAPLNCASWNRFRETASWLIPASNIKFSEKIQTTQGSRSSPQAIREADLREMAFCQFKKESKFNSESYQLYYLICLRKVWFEIYFNIIEGKILICLMFCFSPRAGC